ncbi:nucleoside diphosphate kinase regulator [Luteimonas sp. RD2P54]|uniref:Nucleoside diphosphate kinase regulator n=1 Tax=Luteimonas endophytica TaxID=3042023 RepID=A0ABT6J5Q6_9GAMM|nr:nucleoside diphosphate kinase regulator [Luteimonas endophytica]MDH5822161.1 nucleoside diphosphate kinase regulator [Luteimonas endophytica]
MHDQNPGGPPPPIVVSETDAARLDALLESDAWRNHPAAAALQAELVRAEVRPLAGMPPDVVGMHSTVDCEDVHSGSHHRLVLVYPREADVASGKVSVLAPVGSALLGLAVGQHIDWEAPGGRKLRLRVTAVAPRADG